MLCIWRQVIDSLDKKFLKTKGTVPKQWTETSTKISTSIDQVFCNSYHLNVFEWSIFQFS